MIELTFDASVCQCLATTLLHFLWQGAAVALVAAALARLARNGSARSRYAMHLAALLTMAACPVVTYAVVGAVAEETTATGEARSASRAGDDVPTESGRRYFAARDARTPEAGEAAEGERRPLTASVPDRPREKSAAATPAWLTAATDWSTASRYVVGAYLVGLTVMLLRVAASMYGGHRLRRDSVAVGDPELSASIRAVARRIGLRKAPLVAFCRRVTGPVVIGVLRPAVLLPLALAGGITAAQIEAVLAHEFAHLRRRDHWVLISQRLVEAMLFFHPGVWYVSRRLSEERENCCDDDVIAAGSSRSAYAELLLLMAERKLDAERPAAAALAAAGGRSSLRRRIARILEPRRQPGFRVGRAEFLGAACLLLVTVLLPALPYVIARTAPPDAGANAEDGAADAQGQGQDNGDPPARRADVEPPRQLAEITRTDQLEPGEIAWGKEHRGLVVGIGRVSTSWKSPMRPVVDAYLENRGSETIQGVMLSRARFVLELDGKYYVEADFGGPVGRLEPGKRAGPVVLTTDHFNRIERLEANSVVDQTTPGPRLTEGAHTARVHFKLLDDGKDEPLVASGAVRFDVTLRPYPLDDAVKAIVKQLSDADSDVRRDAALAAGRLKLAGCQTALVRVLKDEDKVIRRYSAESLGKLADASVAEPLRELLTDPEMDVRLAAAESLVQVGVPLDPSWVEPIIKSKHNVFQNAIWLVRRNAGKQAVPTLIRCLDFEDASVGNYYNYTLVWQIHACGGPDLKYHHDFDQPGTPEQIEANRQVLTRLKAVLEQASRENADDKQSSNAPEGPAMGETVPVRVVTSDERPVAGATVIAVVNGKRWPTEFRTDQQGRIEVPAAWEPEDPWTETRVSLWANDDQGRIGWLDFPQHHALARDGGWSLELLPRDRTVQGRLVDESGRSIPGVEIVVESLIHERNRHVHCDDPVGRSVLGAISSDAHGYFRIRFPSKCDYALRFMHQDWIRGRMRRQLDDDGKLGDIRLSRAGWIVGRVVDAETGLASVGHIVIAQAQDSGSLSDRTASWGTATTDKNGRYLIGGLPAGRYNVLFAGLGQYHRWTAAADEGVQVRVGEGVTSDFRAERGRRLYGNVVSSETGEPLSGIHVGCHGTARPQSGAACMMVRTRQNGSYQFFVPPGVAKLYVAEGNRTQVPDSTRTVRVPDDRDLGPLILKAGPARDRGTFGSVEAASDSSTERTTDPAAPRQAAARTKRPFHAEVNLQPPDGVPVNRVTVHAVRDGRSRTSMWSVHTGTEFAIPLGGFDRSTVFFLIEADGFQPVRSPVIIVAKQMPPITVSLKREILLPVRGRVVDRSGRPAAGARIRVRRQIHGQETKFPWGLEYRTGDDGYYEVEHARVGDRVRLHVDVEGQDGREVSSEWIDVRAERPTELPDLVLPAVATK